MPEEKARIVAESYDAGETVSAVARRYALSPQQLFACGMAPLSPMETFSARISSNRFSRSTILRARRDLAVLRSFVRKERTTSCRPYIGAMSVGTQMRQ
ncbi:MAG: transposase [Mesorhizobium sp.]|nr:transposase [Mesorhizobium sp.]